MNDESKSSRTRQRILDAAAACFSELGYAGVNLRRIAARAKMKAGSLYYHFDSKDELVEEVIRVGLDTAVRATRGAVQVLGADADPIVKLRAAIAAHLATILAESDYASADLRILAQLPEPIRKRHLERQRQYGAFWSSLLQSAAASGRLRRDLNLSVVRMLLLGALNWSVEWYRPDGETPGEIAEHLSAMILDGLLAKEGVPAETRWFTPGARHADDTSSGRREGKGKPRSARSARGRRTWRDRGS
jgi:AcrR family transcriptional regulator